MPDPQDRKPRGPPDERPQPANSGDPPVVTEVPAGPGDAGASDRPQVLHRPVRRHPARRAGSSLWVPVLLIVLIGLVWGLVRLLF